MQGGDNYITDICPFKNTQAYILVERRQTNLSAEAEDTGSPSAVDSKCMGEDARLLRGHTVRNHTVRGHTASPK